jgi:hypothetical protein
MISTMIRTKTFDDTYDRILAKSNVEVFSVYTGLRRSLFKKTEIYWQIVEDIRDRD